VAAGDEAGDREPDHALLADDDAVDVLLDPAEELRCTLGLKGGFLGRRHAAKSRTRPVARNLISEGSCGSLNPLQAGFPNYAAIHTVPRVESPSCDSSDP